MTDKLTTTKNMVRLNIYEVKSAAAGNGRRF